MNNGFFKPDLYFTVLNAANTIKGYEIDDGLCDFCDTNVSVQFVDIKNIFAIVNDGPCFRQIFITEDSPIIYGSSIIDPLDGETIDVYNVTKAEFGPVKQWTKENVLKLINIGADISVGNYNIVRWSLMYNFEIFYFLQDYISNTDEELWGNIILQLQNEGLI